MIAIVNTGGANLASIACACERLGAAFQITLDSDAIRAASHVILPGVGAARDAMIKITANGLNHFLPTLKQPVLGICLGMQLFYQHSAEGDTPCLGILPGVVRRITVRGLDGLHPNVGSRRPSGRRCFLKCRPQNPPKVRRYQVQLGNEIFIEEIKIG